MKAYITDFSKKYYQHYEDDIEIKRDLKVEEINKGIALPLRIINKGNTEEHNNPEYFMGGIIQENGQFVSLSETHRGGTSFRSLSSGYELKEKPRYVDETVIYGGILYAFYGHVLLESMARLWYYIKYNPNHYRVIFNIVPDAKGKWKEFFELLDIPYDDNTFITEPTQYKKVIVPEQATIYAASYHKCLALPFDYMASKVKAAKYDKIYFTRTKLTERNPVYGEKQIENIFRKNGYKVFSPERLSLRQQIALMKGCKSLATVSSSTYHNLLFAQDGAELVCLNRAFEADSSQFVVDKAKMLNVTYIDVSLAPLPITHVHGPWIVGITQEFLTYMKNSNFKGIKGLKAGEIKKEDFVQFTKKWYFNNANLNFSKEEVLFCQSRIHKIK